MTFWSARMLIRFSSLGLALRCGPLTWVTSIIYRIFSAAGLPHLFTEIQEEPRRRDNAKSTLIKSLQKFILGERSRPLGRNQSWQ
jgi:hypothetical protein